jgi:hypothetical protein
MSRGGQKKGVPSPNKNTKSSLTIHNDSTYIHNASTAFPLVSHRFSTAFSQLIRKRIRRFSAPFPHLLHTPLCAFFSAVFAQRLRRN